MLSVPLSRFCFHVLDAGNIDNFPRCFGRPRNPVTLFFQSLLPDFNTDDPQAFVDAHAEDEPDEGIAEVWGNVQTLMNALRDLLHNSQQPLNENDQEELEQD